MVTEWHFSNSTKNKHIWKEIIVHCIAQLWTRIILYRSNMNVLLIWTITVDGTKVANKDKSAYPLRGAWVVYFGGTSEKESQVNVQVLCALSSSLWAAWNSLARLHMSFWENDPYYCMMSRAPLLFDERMRDWKSRVTYI